MIPMFEIIENKKIKIEEMISLVGFEMIKEITDTAVVIHVGLPRTGTTFIQNEIFEKSPEVNYIDRRHAKLKKDKKKLIDKKGKIWYFKKYPEYISDDKINVISDEMLCYSPERKKILRGFKKRFSDAKIIVGLRDKQKWKKSWYNKYIKSGGVHTFDFWKENILLNFDFKEYTNFLENNFNEVFIYKFKELKSYKRKVIKKMCDFIDIKTPLYKNNKHNKSINRDYLEAIRILNHLYNTNYNHSKIGFLPDENFPKPATIIKKIDNFF